jgi:hypothetical protein
LGARRRCHSSRRLVSACRHVERANLQ